MICTIKLLNSNRLLKRGALSFTLAGWESQMASFYAKWIIHYFCDKKSLRMVEDYNSNWFF